MSKAGKRLLSAVAELIDHIRNDGEWDTRTTSNGVTVMTPRTRRTGGINPPMTAETMDRLRPPPPTFANGVEAKSGWSKPRRPN